MIVKKKNQMYTSKRSMVHGRGYVDVLKGIGSYMFENKDLIAKPMMGAVGNLAALALTQGGKSIINRLAKEKELKPEAKQIIADIMRPSANNIIGSGIKKF